MDSASCMDNYSASQSERDKDHDQKTMGKDTPVMKHRSSSTMKDNQSNKKSHRSHQPTQASEVKNISPFNTETENYQILHQFFSQKVGQFYQIDLCRQERITLEQWKKLQKTTLVEIFVKDLQVLWGQIRIEESQIFSYLSLINQIRYAMNKFWLLQDSSNSKYYCLVEISQQRKVIEVSQIEAKLLRNRKKFMEIFEYSVLTFPKNGSSTLMSEISCEISFLYQNMILAAHELSKKVSKITQNSMEMLEENTQKNVNDPWSRYSSVLLFRTLKESLSDEKIDPINFFRDNSIRQQCLDLTLGSLKGFKDFEDFIKKKKSYKYSTTTKAILHTACQGCFGYHFEQANPIIFCHECGARFHQVCFQGIQISEKNVICNSCDLKKSNNNSRIKKKECHLCGAKGLLNVLNNEKQYNHVFCLIMHGLWKASEGKIVYSLENKSLVEQFSKKQKCQCCGNCNKFTKKCMDCSNHAHPSCAYLEGWKIDIQKKQSNEFQVMMRCCSQTEQEKKVLSNQRKFILNYKKEALKKMPSIFAQ